MSAMQREIRPRRLRVLKWVALSLVGVPLLYLLAGLVGGTVPTNRDWRVNMLNVGFFNENLSCLETKIFHL